MRIDLTNRVAAIEERRQRTFDQAADRERAAASVFNKLRALASRFDSTDSTIPIEQRLSRMSPAEHCAWGIRFQPEPLPLAAVMRLHGLSSQSPRSLTASLGGSPPGP